MDNKYTITNNMDVMEYQDSGTPKDRLLQDNCLDFSNKLDVDIEAAMLKLYFRAKKWPNGPYKIIVENNELLCSIITATPILSIEFETADQALEFIHKNQKLVDEINSLLKLKEDMKNGTN